MGSAVFMIFFVLLLVGGVIAVIIAFFGSGVIADKFVNLIWAEGNDNYTVQPQYSIAHSRIAAGQFEEAIQEFRNGMRLYPKDLTVHFYIADVYATHLKQPLDGLTELDMGMKRTKDPEQIARFILRKADIHLLHRNDPFTAAAEVENYLTQYPKAKAAIVLNERLKFIRQRQDAQQG